VTRLHIRLLGGFEVDLDGQRVALWESDSVRALLARLVVEPGRPVRRAVLAELMWPERPQGAALANLRHALTVLRRAVGDDTADHPLIRATTLEVVADPAADVQIDVVELLRHAHHRLTEPDSESAWRAVAELDRGEFLAGIDVRAGEAWDDWLAATRAHVVRATLLALRQLAEVYELGGTPTEAESVTRRVLALDPWDEPAHRRLIRLLAVQGRRAEALQHADCFTTELTATFGAPADPLTLQLIDQVRRGRFPATSAATRPESALDGHAPAHTVQASTTFVDRLTELAWLDGHLERASIGHGGVVLVAGEAGSGKTALLDAFAWRAAGELPRLLIAGGRCNAFAGIGDPYLPFRQIMATLCGDPERTGPSSARDPRKVASLWAALPDAVTAVLDDGPYLLGAIVDPGGLQARLDADRPGSALADRLRATWSMLAPQADDPMRQRQPLLDHTVRVLRRIARDWPMLLVIDDLQWADPGSVELLLHLARNVADTPILVAVAYRPEGLIETGAQAAAIRELRSTADDVQLDLVDSRAFVDAWLASELRGADQSFADRLFATTRGHPLFTVEVTHAMQHRGALVRDRSGRWSAMPALDWEAVPPRVEAVIEARLAALAPEQRADLEAASVQAETFWPNVIGEVRGLPGDAVAARLATMAGQPHPLIVEAAEPDGGGERTARYRFRHALFHHAVYATLRPPERRRLHGATGDAMLASHPDDEQLAVLLARHFDEAGRVAEAITQHERAGRRAMALSATTEAISHLERALVLLDTEGIDDGDRTGQQQTLLLGLLTRLGSCLQQRDGYTAATTEAIYERVRRLAGTLGTTLEGVQALGAVVTVDCLRARYRAAGAGAEQMLLAGRQLGLPLIEAVAHMQAGLVTLMTGQPAVADEHLRAVSELYDPRRDGWLTAVVGQDVGVTAAAWRSIATWELGRPGEARRTGDLAIALARQAGHPFSLAFALAIGGCLVGFLRSEPERALAAHAELIRIAEREGLAFYREAARVQGGLAHAVAGDLERGIDEIGAGLTGWHRLGTEAFACWVGCTRVELLARTGRRNEARRLLDEIAAGIDRTGEELARGKWWLAAGRTRLAAGEPALAAQAFRSAIDVCSSRHQWSTALQAATALVEVLDQLDDGDDGRATLAPIVDRIVDGDDTADVRAARSLLSR
jgi:DNA-binding SARP family transcriptional activator